MDYSQIIILLIIGGIAGIMGGFIGIGGGLIIIPALIYIMKLSPSEASGTSLALMLPPIGILAFWEYYKNGNVRVEYAIVIGIAFVIGGYFGGKWANKINNDIIKLVFGIIMLYVAIQFILSSTKNLR